MLTFASSAVLRASWPALQGAGKPAPCASVDDKACAACALLLERLLAPLHGVYNLHLGCCWQRRSNGASRCKRSQHTNLSLTSVLQTFIQTVSSHGLLSSGLHDCIPAFGGCMCSADHTRVLRLQRTWRQHTRVIVGTAAHVAQSCAPELCPPRRQAGNWRHLGCKPRPREVRKCSDVGNISRPRKWTLQRSVRSATDPLIVF